MMAWLPSNMNVLQRLSRICFAGIRCFVPGDDGEDGKHHVVASRLIESGVV